MSSSKRFNKSILPANTKLVIKHFHTGNTDPDQFPLRQGNLTRSYATRAQVRDRQSGDVLAEDWALCGKNVAASRKLGTEIASGRCIKEFVLKTKPYG